MNPSELVPGLRVIIRHGAGRLTGTIDSVDGRVARVRVPREGDDDLVLTRAAAFIDEADKTPPTSTSEE